MRILNRPTLALLAVIATACHSEDIDRSAGSVCVSGQSIACFGTNGCQGYQVCRVDGSAYDGCICGESSVARGGSGNSIVGTGRGSTGAISPTGGASPTSSAATTANGSGASGTSTPMGSGGGATTGRPCAPADMSNYAYPAYRPARRLFASCTDSDVQAYFSDCFRKGNCSEFLAGGTKENCGACLAPTNADAASYGPLIRLGSATSPLDDTNMAGCIELLGEGECAKKMSVAALCEYYSCGDSCPATDTASYQALMSCMSNARTTTCSSAQSAAVCITDSAHVAACSGSGFEGQFLAIAHVFCVQTH